MEVQVIQTGTANLASVLAALRRAETIPLLCADPWEVRNAGAVVLPGVGTLAAAMQRLEEDGLVDALRKRIESGKPTLAICLGLQLLCESSEESEELPGLGVIDAKVTRLPDGVRVPQLGWNQVEPGDGCRLLQPGYAYFAHSYRIEGKVPGWSAAMTDHGSRFVSALERGGVLACQFHPELSGRWGQDLIERWLDDAAARGGA